MTDNERRRKGLNAANCAYPDRQMALAHCGSRVAIWPGSTGPLGWTTRPYALHFDNPGGIEVICNTVAKLPNCNRASERHYRLAILNCRPECVSLHPPTHLAARGLRRRSVPTNA